MRTFSRSGSIYGRSRGRGLRGRDQVLFVLLLLRLELGRQLLDMNLMCIAAIIEAERSPFRFRGVRISIVLFGDLWFIIFGGRGLVKVCTIAFGCVVLLAGTGIRLLWTIWLNL